MVQIIKKPSQVKFLKLPYNSINIIKTFNMIFSRKNMSGIGHQLTRLLVNYLYKCIWVYKHIDTGLIVDATSYTDAFMKMKKKGISVKNINDLKVIPKECVTLWAYQDVNTGITVYALFYTDALAKMREKGVCIKKYT